MPSPSLRPESTLRFAVMRREALQLTVVAVGTAAALLFESRTVSLIAVVVDAIAALLAAVAGIVAWRVSGRGGAVLFYAAAVLVFVVLGFLNLRH